MTTPDLNPSPAFYFALPRLFSRLLGHGSAVSENNWLEAHLGSFLVFTIPYVLGAYLFLWEPHGWIAFMGYALLLFAVCAFWLFALYANSLIIKVIRACGVFRETPDRYVQDILVWVLIIIFAGRLAVSDSWLRWVGVVCLAVISLNVAAAVFLTLLNRAAQMTTD